MKDTKKSLSVALRGMDSRTVKTMKLFLFGPCNGAAHVVDKPEEAEVDIFDLDIPSSKAVFDQIQLDLSVKPVIVLSVRDFKHEKILYVKKPVNKDSMLEVLTIAKKQLADIDKKNAKQPVQTQANADQPSSGLAADVLKNYVDPKVVDILKDVDDWFDF